MAEPTIAVGCIEDHEPDVALLKHALEQSRISIGSFTVAQRLSEAHELVEAAVDVILLDLGLPDSSGVQTVERAREIAGSIPLVVLTASNESGRAAIAAGADDFLDKDLIGNGQLARIVEFAVERNRLRVRLDQLENDRELQQISDRSQPTGSRASAKLLGEVPMRDTAPEVHDQAVGEFVSVVRLRLSNNAMGVASPEDGRMRDLGERIAVRNAGPDDVVRILTESVDSQRLHMSPAQYAPFVREARVALIELMGFVLAYYRRHAPIGITQQRPSDAESRTGPRRSTLRGAPVSTASPSATRPIVDVRRYPTAQRTAKHCPIQRPAPTTA